MNITKKILAGSATLCALVLLATPFSTVSARSSSTNTNHDYSRDNIYPHRSDRSVMDQKRGMMNKDMKMKMDHRKDMMNKKLSQTKVKEVQNALDQRGYAVGKIDGVWGPRTREAIRDFQSNQGIEASGTLDSETFRALGVESEGSMYSE